MDLEDVKLGDRFVDIKGFYGTVLFKGIVGNTKGSWLGVEWDDMTRGSHNGTKDGISYFKTKCPTSGSFIRTKIANFGVTCFSAICDRYGKLEDENAGIDVSEMYVYGQGMQQTTVEMVGARKVNQQQSQLDQLEVAVLREMYIYGNGPGQEIHQCTSNIRELNLSKNLLPSMEEVAKITQQLPQLEILNLSENQLQMPQNLTHKVISSFSNLKMLLINKMDLTWSQVLLFCKTCPNLEQLIACYNHIDNLNNVDKVSLTNLQLLNLEGNKLGGWNQVLNLGKLPNLSTLILNKTTIDTIELPSESATDKTNLFKSLKSLSISDNKLDKWTHINELNNLHQLEELKMKRNPMMDDMTTETARQHIIARIGGLLTVNNTQLSASERRGAEIDYLKTFGMVWKENGGSEDSEKCQVSQEFRIMHPRYQELVKRHGAAESSEMKIQSSALKYSLISVIIENVSSNDPGIKKKIPVTMTVQKLKSLAQRLYKIRSTSLKLAYKSQKMAGPKIELDNELRTVSYYSIEEGDTICVSS